MMDENMPYIVMSVVLVLIVFAVGSFAFFVVTSEIGYETEQIEEFTVTDPTVAKSCLLEQGVNDIISVTQFNGYTWETVDPSHYSLVGQTVIVQPSGMQG